MYRRCLYGKDTFEYSLDFGTNFINAYKDKPKVLNLELIDMHEPTGEVVKFMDSKLEAFLE